MENPSQSIFRVAVEAPFFKALNYIVPPELQGQAKIGQKVFVPLGKREASGVLLGPATESTDRELKAIARLDPEHSPIPESYLQWLTWISDYYFFPLGATLGLAFPPLKKAAEGKSKSSKRSLFQNPTLQEPDRVLTPEQLATLQKIRPFVIEGGFSVHLIFGVTGSGKTEIYLQLLQDVLKQGRRGLLLVPEISLTPQLIDRFAGRFGDQVAVLHSQLTERERTNFWWDIREGKKSILLGARSAQFCPIDNLGLIVVDEEHEPSFKQDEKLKYHGRDAAVMLAKFCQVPILLGSATPSLESWKNAHEGKYHLHTLQSRVENRALPEIQIVDMRELSKPKKETAPQTLELPFWMSPQLHSALQETLLNKKQAALFLNRRGAAALVICPSCGFTHKCPNCDINLTLHGQNHLVCHYCDYHENFKVACPDCKEGELTPVGLGTEALEKSIQELFPTAKVGRADRDEITSRADLEDLIRRMESFDIDILIGTQMIAKGLDFKNLTLVGVVLADIGFNIPDFRASERSFQLLTQVAGRAGRHVQAGESPGQVIIQTYSVEHPSLTHARNHSFSQFAQEELFQRRELLYPPYGKLLSVRIQGNELEKVQQTARLFATRAQALKSKQKLYSEIEVLGPAPAPLAKLRGKYRFHLLLKGAQSGLLNGFCRQVFADESWVSSGVRLIPDVDPLHLL